MLYVKVLGFRILVYKFEGQGYYLDYNSGFQIFFMLDDFR